jgi:hypothetical protein
MPSGPSRSCLFRILFFSFSPSPTLTLLRKSVSKLTSRSLVTDFRLNRYVWALWLQRSTALRCNHSGALCFAHIYQVRWSGVAHIYLARWYTCASLISIWLEVIHAHAKSNTHTRHTAKITRHYVHTHMSVVLMHFIFFPRISTFLSMTLHALSWAWVCQKKQNPTRRVSDAVYVCACVCVCVCVCLSGSLIRGQQFATRMRRVLCPHTHTHTHTQRCRLYTDTGTRRPFSLWIWEVICGISH